MLNRKALPVAASWLFHLLLALAAGGCLATLAQIESHFAEEEFFVALQALVLAGYWLAGVAVWKLAKWGVKRIKGNPPPAPPITETAMGGESHHSPLAHGYSPFAIRHSPFAAIGLLAVFAVAFIILAIRSYQTSFYPVEAPAYPGISAETPFLCGEAPPDSQTYDGQETFRRILALVAANPYAGPPEFGMLALGTGESRWLDTFHDALLAEARQGAFTGAAGSVKSVQHDAALRVYYYSRVQAAFPDLFTLTEQDELRQWFAAINHRALTIEPVDWMYALAFTKWPAGPYENQESGAGLLAQLETTGLADPALSPRNRAYLDDNRRGWSARFRVTDDAAVYQPEWLDNAFFQSLYTGDAPPDNVKRSFEWLLLQALPDGAPLQYNHPGAAILDGIAYLGAKLTGDDRFVWLAGRTTDYLTGSDGYTFAQPGLDAAAGLVGHSPTQGSCLLYGDSGLPNQLGPLAPDKIVFRDGWSTDSAYLLLNLRFTGWHRYKATNTVTLIYQNGALTGDQLSGETFGWLPTGRSLFRDKRIPRENLNGLVIERSGLSAIVAALTGIGGKWAQDPPYYASVEAFATGPDMDTSTTVLTGWRGWTHRRTIYFYHDGPIVIMDNANGPAASSAAVVWQLPEGVSANEGRVAPMERITLRAGDHPAEMVIIPIAGEIHGDEGAVQIQGKGKISAVTVFLTKSWVGAQVSVSEGKLIVTQGEQRVSLDLVLP